MSTPEPAAPAPGEPVDAGELRRAMGRFATGVAVVTTRDRGIDHAMTVNALTSVSLDPPLLLVCVEQEARFHDAVTAAGFFAVSLLQESARPVAAWLATRGRPLHDQLDRVPHRAGAVTGSALVDGALATLECRTSALHDGGDHTIVVGEVVAAELGDDQAAPLLWYRAGYARLP